MNIYQKGFRDNTEAIKLWSENVNNGNVWKYGSVTINNNFTEPDYKILVEGVVGSGMQGDIAVDDLKFSDNICPTPPSECAFKCSNSTCLPDTKVCNFIDDCSGGEEELKCGYNTTFENDMGGWLEISDGTFKWVRSQGGNPLANSGASFDHTIGTPGGYFLYVETANGTTENLAQLKSPVLRDSSSSCQLKFWYYLNGEYLTLFFL